MKRFIIPYMLVSNISNVNHAVKIKHSTEIFSNSHTPIYNPTLHKNQAFNKNIYVFNDIKTHSLYIFFLYLRNLMTTKNHNFKLITFFLLISTSFFFFFLNFFIRYCLLLFFLEKFIIIYLSIYYIYI